MMTLFFTQPLKRALSRMGIQNLVPDNTENVLSYSVITYLKKLKNMASSLELYIIYIIFAVSFLEVAIEFQLHSFLFQNNLWCFFCQFELHA